MQNIDLLIWVTKNASEIMRKLWLIERKITLIRYGRILKSEV